MRGLATWGLTISTAACLLGGALLVGCHPPEAAYIQKLRSPNPLDRAEGIRAAERAGDSRAIQPLVVLLGDSDPAVRMFAEVALRELTGQDFGYRYYAQPAEREAGIERWQQALREGRVAARRGRASGPATQPQPAGGP